MLYFIAFLLIAALGACVALYRKNAKLTAEREDMAKKAGQTEFMQSRLDELKGENNRLDAENRNLTAEKAALEARMADREAHLNDKIEELKNARDSLSLQFKSVSVDLLKEQTVDFKKNQQESLGQMLNPLKDQLDAFKKRMEEINQINAGDKGRMDQQLSQLLKMNQTLSADAQNLTNALKGNTKHQGDWGEMQLERMFEISGMEKGVDYCAQENRKDDDGNNKRPDYIVNLPDNRRLIIDCKVSLNAYMRFVRADNPDDRKKYLAEHVRAIRDHIRELASKDYQSLIKEQGLDYVFMFIPVEQAYIEAISADPEIYADAYQSRIALTTASSLLPVLRTVQNLWQIERQNKNVMEIAKQGGSLYDKLVGFIEDMRGIDKALVNARSSYDEALKKLATGRGNAIVLAERMKTLGAKAAKKLPVELVEKAEMIEYDGEG